MVSKRERERRKRTIPAWYSRRMLTASKPMELVLQVLLIYRLAWLTTLIAAAIFVKNRVIGHAIAPFDWVLLIVIGIPAFVAVISIFGTNLGFLIEYHGVRHQWARVSALLPRFERQVSRAFGEPMARVAAAKWRARMLGHTHSLEAGLSELLPLGGDPEIPRGEWLGALASFYQELFQRDEARATIVELTREDPQNAVSWGAVVECDGVLFDDAEIARHALETARSCPNFSTLGPVVDYLEGVTLCTERAYDEAIEHLSKFRAWSSAAFHRMPAALSIDAAAGTMLAVAMDGIGRSDEARETLVGLKGLLKNQQASHLLAHCREVLVLRGVDHLLQTLDDDTELKPA